MSSLEISEKHQTITDTVDEKTTLAFTSAHELPRHGTEHIHFVRRAEGITNYDYSHEVITGYDHDRMQARAALSSEEEKKLLWRVDWHLMPLLAVMYMLKSIDSTNVSNARIMDNGTPWNILTQLHITSNQYNLVTTLYYIPYILAEAPSNLLVKRMKPSRFLSRIMITWGAVLCFHAAVKNRQGLYTLRFLLGLFEAGLWPGILTQMCYWYRADELPLRIVLVTILGNFSSVISGVLAFAFNGVTTGGLSGWKWLILSEGIFTVCLGVFVLFFCPDFPPDASWLTEKEKAFLQARLPINAPRAAEANFDFHEIIEVMKNKRLWLFTLCWAFFTVGTTGLTFYQPTVIANLGFTSIANDQLLNIPAAAFSVVLTLFFGYVSTTGRIPQPLIPLLFMIVIEACYAVLYTFPNTGGVYVATILAGGCSTAWYTMMWPWRIQTTERATGSAFALSFVNSYGQIGGAVGSQLFNSRYAPHYTTSFAIAMALVGLAILMNLITWYFTANIDKSTRKLRRVRIAAAKRDEAVLDDVDIHADEKVGDRSADSL